MILVHGNSMAKRKNGKMKRLRTFLEKFTQSEIKIVVCLEIAIFCKKSIIIREIYYFVTTFLLALY